MVPLKMAQGQQQQKVLLLVEGAVVAVPVVTAQGLNEPAGAWKLVPVWMPIQRCCLPGEWIEVEDLAGGVQEEQAHLELMVGEPSFCISFQFGHPLTSHLPHPLMTTLSHPLRQCHLDVVPYVEKFTHP